MGFCLPRGYDASFVIASIGVDHCDFYAVHKANSVNADFTIVETIINTFDGQSFENPLGIRECNSMLLKVAAVLFYCPSI
jgi:hypothetical protein